MKKTDKMPFSKDILVIKDVKAECDSIAIKLRENVLHRMHRTGAVVGISGGIDSSVSLALSVLAFGAENVLGIMLPEKDSSGDSALFAQRLADKFGVKAITENITGALQGFGCYQRRDEAVKNIFPEYDPARYKMKIGVKSSGLYTNLPPLFSIVIIDDKGYIITNNHVIEGGKSTQVIYSDGSKVDATVVGADTLADIAVLKVEGKVPAVAAIGDSNALEPGQTAIAIGSPLGDFRGTVTVGVISAVNRRVGPMQGLLQTDAAINNGNSGGPLINNTGQVIGINTLVVRATNEGNVAEGLGFAIPSNQVRQIVDHRLHHARPERRSTCNCTFGNISL